MERWKLTQLVAAAILLGWASLVYAGDGGDRVEPVPSAASSEKPSSPRLQAGTDPLDDRIRKVEAANRAILERLDRSERERRLSEDRYRSLERKYDDLRNRLEPIPGHPAGSTTNPAAEIGSGTEHSHSHSQGENQTPGSVGGDPTRKPPEGFAEIFDGHGSDDRPLRASFGEGFSFKSWDDEYQLRLRVLDQTDFKVFVPGDQYPARSGLYIPRVRVYFEGQLTRLFQYEVSIQRSVEGVWDLLDGNVNIVPDRRLQARFGRMLVPYSYDWYDHLEQYFITPERALFPLNFGLSRSAGIMAHGLLFDDRLEYAAGGFDGHLTGLADNNTTRDAVGYLNFKPFLQSEQFPLLRYLNIGASGFLGQQVSPLHPLPLRTSLQSSENDEAAQSASSLFLEYNPDTRAYGGRSATALHVAWYAGGLSFEAEWQGGRDHLIRTGLNTTQSVPVSGNHFTAAYFLTGEKVTGWTMVSPLRPFDPATGSWGPGAVEVFARYSHLSIGDTIFRGGFADPNVWTRDIDLVDVGLNWYLTRYIKIYFDWQHSTYGSPVLLNPSKGQYGRDNDLFWIRGQLYY